MQIRIVSLSAILVGAGCILDSGETAPLAENALASEASEALMPFAATGAPIRAPQGAWTWIDFPDSFCRDGSTSGIVVNLNPRSTNLMIALDGGGACFDAVSCKLNDARASRSAPNAAGIFDRANRQNPVRDWNFVYVPYCTGDVHAGTNRNGKIANVPGIQRFVGRLNMEAFLRRIVPTFGGVQRVLLTGTSAGGFGTAASAVLVQRAFMGIKVRAIDDSGPPLSGAYLAPCLQAKWRDTWGLDKSMLADCGSYCPDRDDFIFDYAQYWAKLYRDRSSGLIESSEDTIIRSFFGAGALECRGNLLTPLLPRKFREGLLEFRDAIADYGKFATFYPSSRQHTWLGDNSFYTARTGGISLLEWFTDILDDRPAQHAAP